MILYSERSRKWTTKFFKRGGDVLCIFWAILSSSINPEVMKWVEAVLRIPDNVIWQRLGHLLSAWCFLTTSSLNLSIWLDIEFRVSHSSNSMKYFIQDSTVLCIFGPSFPSKPVNAGVAISRGINVPPTHQSHVRRANLSRRSLDTICSEHKPIRLPACRRNLPGTRTNLRPFPRVSFNNVNVRSPQNVRYSPGVGGAEIEAHQRPLSVRSTIQFRIQWNPKSDEYTNMAEIREPASRCSVRWTCSGEP